MLAVFGLDTGSDILQHLLHLGFEVRPRESSLAYLWLVIADLSLLQPAQLELS